MKSIANLSYKSEVNNGKQKTDSRNETRQIKLTGYFMGNLTGRMIMRKKLIVYLRYKA